VPRADKHLRDQPAAVSPHAVNCVHLCLFGLYLLPRFRPPSRGLDLKKSFQEPDSPIPFRTLENASSTVIQGWKTGFTAALGLR
jgi:hypothetical protein